MSVAVYVRVSTVSQNLEGQQQEIQRWLDGNAVADVRWFVDHGKTGNDLSRPAFDEMQAAIFNGEVQTIVVYRLDRISRKLRDGINVLCDWCERKLRVVSVMQQLDFNGTVGQMIASVLFAVAEMEQETRRERQAAGIRAAKKRGVYRGRKPGTTRAKPARAQELRDQGLTVAEIATALGVSSRTAGRYLAR